MREKLIELLKELETEKYLDTYEEQADHLIACGVIVLPCKVGDTVWVIDERFSSRDGKGLPIIRCEIDEFSVRKSSVFVALNGAERWFAVTRFKWVLIGEFGKTVFLTREEAEAALKEDE